MYCKYYVIAFFLFLADFSLAQPLEKAKQSSAIWLEQQFFSDSLSRPHWFIESQFRYSTLKNNNSKISDSFPFYRAQLMVGKLWFFNQSWQGGVSGRYALENNRSLFFSRLFLRHRGYLKKIKLIKRLDWEHITDSIDPSLYWARTSGFIEAERVFKLNKRIIYSSVSYQFFINHRTAQNPIPEDNERFIDRTRLRLNVGLPINRWLVSLFLLRETDYFYAQEVFDETGSLKKPFRKLNIFTPTYGLSIRYIWSKESK